jgi:hypothetical protein
MPNSGTPPTVLDVAVGHLAEPVTDVAPLSLASAPPLAGATVATVGFGRHPTSAAPDPTCLQQCNGDCMCQANTCGCKNLQPLFANTCLCTDQGSYDQLVKRTATVTIADVLATTLHQSVVTDSVDLPGDSGGPVLYNGAIVGTDCCGDGPQNAQTDQFFARVDLAHDWIVGMIQQYEGDAGQASGGDAGGSSADASPIDGAGGDDAATGSTNDGASSSDDAGPTIDAAHGGSSGADSGGGVSDTGGGDSGSAGGCAITRKRGGGPQGGLAAALALAALGAMNRKRT